MKTFLLKINVIKENINSKLYLGTKKENSKNVKNLFLRRIFFFFPLD